MDRYSYGLIQHNCTAINRPLLIPVGVEKYNSKVVVSARCQVCGKFEMEQSVDKAVPPAKGNYITV